MALRLAATLHSSEEVASSADCLASREVCRLEQESTMTSILEELRQLATVDIFRDVQGDGSFVGRPFYLDFSRMRVLSNDKWKYQVGGVPAGAFLLCVYEGEPGVAEAILVRVLGPTKLPTDDDVVASMVDYYKEALPTQAPASRLDSYTRAEFQFSGLECRVLGTFYRDARGHALRRRPRQLLRAQQLPRLQAARPGPRVHRQLPRGRAPRRP
jgi:hypothetical protein